MNEELLAQEWQALIRQYADALPILQSLAETHRVALAREFYEQMLENPGSSPYLSHEQVRTS